MFHRIMKTIAAIYSGEHALQHVYDISRYHRVQASPGLRAAAHHVAAVLENAGIGATVLTFPADGRTRYWGHLMPQEWRCHQARLVHLLEGGQHILCDFAADPISVIQRSAGTPPGGVVYDVVALETGEDEGDYQGRDVLGRLVLTRGDVQRVYELAVRRHGASGIVFDGMTAYPPVRPHLSLSQDRQYTSFWWTGEDHPCLGFVLTPSQGEDLRQAIRRGRVRLHATVNAEFVEGSLEVVTAAIPGETDEEVLLVAHLCHPRPSANDNASGVATALETLITLHALIQQGTLARPRRGIRLLLPPEFTGTYAYLATQGANVHRIIAALNVDMVGEDQDKTGSTFLLEHSPGAAPTFADDLALAIRDALSTGQTGYDGRGDFPGFRHGAIPFSGGSDHAVLADPMVGIPTVMIIQWPDRFYHTNADTPDKVSPASLGRAGILAGTYAYTLANAGQTEAVWLAYEMQNRFTTELARYVQGSLGELMDRLNQSSGRTTLTQEMADAMAFLQRRVLFLSDRHNTALDSITRLGGKEVGKVITALQSAATAAAWSTFTEAQEILLGLAARQGLPPIPPPSAPPEDEWTVQAERLCPQRLYPGPVHLWPYLRQLTMEEQDAWWQLEREHPRMTRGVRTIALFWMDGRRTLRQICDLVELETGVRDAEFLVRYTQLLARVGLLRLLPA